MMVMADMGIMEIAAIVAASTSVASLGYSLSQGAPKVPAAPQQSKDPNVDAFRRQNGSSFAPGAAAAGGGMSLLPGSGSNIGSSTLLGQ
jgi:hypothetical protein